MNNYITILLVLFVTGLAQNSEACFFNCTKPVDKAPEQALHINITESAEQAEQIRQTLIALQTEMLTKFTNIEQNLSSGNTEAALTEAKQVLDSVRVKTGIDPKIRIQQSFLVTTKFPDRARGMTDLDDSARVQVIRTISDFRGGLYMDLMNLSKRTSLLYVRALKAEMIKHGGLTDDDRHKIVNDLVSAALVPMPVEDKDGHKIIAFDQDVANEDHTYLFNRELKMYLIQDAELKLSEDIFDKLMENKKASILGVPAPQVQKTNSVEEKANDCMVRASHISYIDDINNAKNSCFQRYYSDLPDFTACSSLASRISYLDDINNAKKKCFNHFSK